mmetsp:Transcript_71148/g.129850  ORF Transcript_71148/g.129850 Transcript_71148/m.129850 type:complete len:261 (-) Transcript_71148:705-1487(-)
MLVPPETSKEVSRESRCRFSLLARFTSSCQFNLRNKTKYVEADPAIPIVLDHHKPRIPAWMAKTDKRAAGILINHMVLILMRNCKTCLVRPRITPSQVVCIESNDIITSITGRVLIICSFTDMVPERRLTRGCVRMSVNVSAKTSVDAITANDNLALRRAVSKSSAPTAFPTSVHAADCTPLQREYRILKMLSSAVCAASAVGLIKPASNVINSAHHHSAQIANAMGRDTARKLRRFVVAFDHDHLTNEYFVGPGRTEYT